MHGCACVCVYNIVHVYIYMYVQCMFITYIVLPVCVCVCVYFTCTLYVYECMLIVILLCVCAGDSMGIWRWNENIVFDIPVRDVPRGARLCLAIYAVYGSKRTKKKTGKLEAKGVSYGRMGI